MNDFNLSLFHFLILNSWLSSSPPFTVLARSKDKNFEHWVILPELKVHSRIWDNFWQLKAFRNNKNLKNFLFHVKSCFHSEDIYILATFCSCREWLDKKAIKKAKVNFKIYYIKDWTANNYYTHIAQHLEK